MENKALKIELPDDQLTASDLVGRAVRITRLNWRPLMRLLIVPMAIYWVGFVCMVWDPDTYDRNFPADVSFWIISLGLIVNYLCIWELAIRKFALLLFFAKSAQTLEEALSEARRKMWMILFMTLPVYFAEAGMDILSFISAKIGKAATGGQLHDPLMIASVFLNGAEFILLAPLLWVTMMNLFFLAIVAFENTSIASACARFIRLHYQDKLYICIYSTIMSFIFFATIAPTVIVIPLEIILPQSALKYLIIAVASTLMVAPVDTFLSIAVTVGSALLYKQVCARLEGQDLLDRLKSVEAR